MTNSKKNDVLFGHKKVTISEKEKLVDDVFSKTAEKYDLMNDAMSLFQHRLWKKNFIRSISLQENDRLIDVSCGTGDIAYQLYKKAVKQKTALPPIMLTDPNQQMLQKAKNRFVDKGLLTPFSYILSPAENLPFNDNSFDIYTISFGLRNIADRPKALLEAKRVLSPGKKIYCLEFSRPKWPGLDLFYHLYSSHLIPLLGKYIANNKQSYEYLVESIKTFPSQKQLCEEFMLAGFQNITYKSMAGGIVAIHTAEK